jgi:hypothetical protein
VSRCIDTEHASVLYRALHHELGSVTDVSEAPGVNSVSALTNSQGNRCGFSRNPTCTYDVSFPPTCDDHLTPYIHHIYSICTQGQVVPAHRAPHRRVGPNLGVNISALMIFVFPYPLAPSDFGTSGKEGTVVWVRR